MCSRAADAGHIVYPLAGNHYAGWGLNLKLNPDVHLLTLQCRTLTFLSSGPFCQNACAVVPRMLCRVQDLGKGDFKSHRRHSKATMRTLECLPYLLMSISLALLWIVKKEACKWRVLEQL